jgi:hypothetical protein
MAYKGFIGSIEEILGVKSDKENILGNMWVRVKFAVCGTTPTI